LGSDSWENDWFEVDLVLYPSNAGDDFFPIFFKIDFALSVWIQSSAALVGGVLFLDPAAHHPSYWGQSFYGNHNSRDLEYS